LDIAVIAPSETKVPTVALLTTDKSFSTVKLVPIVTLQLGPIVNCSAPSESTTSNILTDPKCS